MNSDQQIAAAMAIRDLMNATITLSELPADLIRADREDIELVHQRLIKLLMRVEEPA